MAGFRQGEKDQGMYNLHLLSSITLQHCVMHCTPESDVWVCTNCIGMNGSTFVEATYPGYCSLKACGLMSCVVSLLACLLSAATLDVLDSQAG